MAPTYYYHHSHYQNSYSEYSDSGSYSDSDCGEAEIKTGHYTNFQKILLVGEGNFSFSSSLATAFHSASNITATSLDSRETVTSKYAEGRDHLRNLEERGALVLHEINAHTMDQHYELRRQLFDRIVFNFPHSGGTNVRESDTNYIRWHQWVVSGFFKASRYMLTRTGEIHVTHKTSHPYNSWNIVDLAEDEGLVLTREAEFDKWDYPQYVNRKGYGSRWNATEMLPLSCSLPKYSIKWS